MRRIAGSPGPLTSTARALDAWRREFETHHHPSREGRGRTMKHQPGGAVTWTPTLQLLVGLGFAAILTIAHGIVAGWLLVATVEYVNADRNRALVAAVFLALIGRTAWVHVGQVIAANVTAAPAQPPPAARRGRAAAPDDTTGPQLSLEVPGQQRSGTHG